MKRSKIKREFGFGEIVKISTVNGRTLDRWASTGFLRPSIKRASGTGTRRVYSFSDIVAARVAKDLKDSGISLQRLRKIVKELRKQDFGEQPLAEVRLIVSGNDVYLKDHQDVISTLSQPGQFSFPFMVMDLAETVNTIRLRADHLKAA